MLCHPQGFPEDTELLGIGQVLVFELESLFRIVDVVCFAHGIKIVNGLG